MTTYIAVVLALAVVLVTLPTRLAGAGDDLAPAGERRAAADARAAKDVKVGKAAKVYGVTVRVDQIDVVEPTADRPRTAHVTVRFENRTKSERNVPSFGLYCRGEEDPTDYYAESDLYGGLDLPAKSFEEGVIVLELPEGCRRPAVRFTQVGGDLKSLGEERDSIEYPFALPG